MLLKSKQLDLNDLINGLITYMNANSGVNTTWFNFIISNIRSKLNTIFFTFTSATNTYTNTNLISTTILSVVREGVTLTLGGTSDEYQFNGTTGTITFGSTVNIGERIIIVSL